MDKKRILFKVNASPRVGFGHFRRSISLAEIMDDANSEIYLQTNENNPLVRNLSSNFLSVLDFVPDSHDGDPEDLRLLLEAAKKIQADWIVLDGYNYGSDFEKAIKDENFKLFRIDDLPTHTYYCDVILSQNYNAEKKDFKIHGNGKRALGLRYLLLSSQFRKLEIKPKRVNAGPSLKILITLGGAADILSKALSLLFESSIQNKEIKHQYSFLIPDRIIHQQFQNQVTTSNIEIAAYTENIASLMQCHDFVITTPGSTMWELLYLGIPFAVLPLNNVQDIYAHELVEDGLCLKLPLLEYCNSEDVKDLFHAASDPILRQKIVDSFFDIPIRDCTSSQIQDLFL